MKIIFVVFYLDVPIAASAFVPSFPVMLVCPLIHSKEVLPPLWCILFMIGLMRFACEVYAKFASVEFSMFSHSTFIAHLESVLICSLHWLGTSAKALWIVVMAGSPGYGNETRESQTWPSC